MGSTVVLSPWIWQHIHQGLRLGLGRLDAKAFDWLSTLLTEQDTIEGQNVTTYFYFDLHSLDVSENDNSGNHI